MQNIENFGKILLLILLMPAKMSLHRTEMAYIHYINDLSHSRTALLKKHHQIDSKNSRSLLNNVNSPQVRGNG